LLAGLGRWFLGLRGWLWRWLAGAFFCTNAFTSILVTGWTYRWLQGLVLRGWWKQSGRAREGTFDEFCDSLGRAAPVARPRWFLQERIRASLTRPAPGGAPAGPLRLALRALCVPWRSLWLNLTTGIKALFCTWLVTGWGCLLMYFGWEYGWLNSFHKGYEEPAFGLVLSLVGIMLFVLSLCYVLLAQVHQAVTGEARAFFDFRFIGRLVRGRLTACCAVAALFTLAALPLEVLKASLVADGTFGNDPSRSDAEVLQLLQLYLFACAVVLFPTLLLVRGLAARMYRSAVLKVLRQGTVTRAELHPVLTRWLDLLQLMPVPVASRPGLARVVGAGSGLAYRGLLYGLLLVIWLLFVAQTYVGEFFLRHRPGGSNPLLFHREGFLNHMLVQFPAVDFVPEQLKASAAR
jgi:hypothetical protein